MGRACYRLKLTLHTSHLTHHTSHLTPHTSHLTPHTSHLTPHTSHLTPHTSHLTPPTSHLTSHTSHLTSGQYGSQIVYVPRIIMCNTSANLPFKLQRYLAPTASISHTFSFNYLSQGAVSDNSMFCYDCAQGSGTDSGLCRYFFFKTHMGTRAFVRCRVQSAVF